MWKNWVPLDCAFLLGPLVLSRSNHTRWEVLEQMGGSLGIGYMSFLCFRVVFPSDYCLGLGFGVRGVPVTVTFGEHQDPSWFSASHTGILSRVVLSRSGCGSKPVVPFWGRCTTHLVYLLLEKAAEREFFPCPLPCDLFEGVPMFSACTQSTNGQRFFLGIKGLYKKGTASCPRRQFSWGA